MQEENVADEGHDRVVNPEEEAPNQADFAPPDVADQLKGPNCIKYEYHSPRDVTAWNECGRRLNLKAIWQFCRDSDCKTVEAGWGLNSKRRSRRCGYDGADEC